jgi:NADPH:quinone reductase-like Zn-dependent oxidoreductase
MKAIVQAEYGAAADVLKVQEIDTTRQTSKTTRCWSASAPLPPTPYDWHYMKGLPYILRLQGSGLRKPKHRVLGSDIAGEVEAIGKNVTRFRPGDQVFANVEAGGFAEYISVSEKALGAKPANLTFEQAAAVPLAALTALQAVRDAGQIQPGHRILIIGASGGIGTFAVQIAKSLGADVTGVCSTKNVEMVRALGADHVIDYTEEDFTQSDRKYDVVLQLAGTRSPSECRQLLTADGTLVLVSGESDNRWIGPVGRILKAVVLSLFVSQRLRPLGDTKRNTKDLMFVKELIEAGQIKPVIDRTYPLSAAPDAIRYVEQGRAQGNVVITV